MRTAVALLLLGLTGCSQGGPRPPDGPWTFSGDSALVPAAASLTRSPGELRVQPEPPATAIAEWLLRNGYAYWDFDPDPFNATGAYRSLEAGSDSSSMIIQGSHVYRRDHK